MLQARPIQTLRRRRSRRLRRAVVALLMMLLALLLIPFLFTNAIVRAYLAGSAYARFNPSFADARLGPAGALVITDLALHEPDTGKPLVSAGRVEVAFKWWQVPGGKLQGVRIDNATVHVRPGDGVPVTLARLVSAGGERKAGGDPLWIDRLVATGTLVVAPDTAVRLPVDRLPFVARMAMDGTRSSPEPYIYLRLGNAVVPREGAPWLSTHVHIVRGQTRLRSFDARHLELTATGAAAGQIAGLLRRPSAPAQTPDHLRLAVERLHLDGVYSRSDGCVEGNIRTVDLMARAAAGDKTLLDLQRLTASVALESPLTGDIRRRLRLDAPGIRAKHLALGEQTVEGFFADIACANGFLTVDGLDAGYARGTVAGEIDIDLPRGRLRTLKLALARLDAHQILSTALPGRVDAEGTFSGPADFTTDAAGQLTGGATLTADAPGRLMIGDEQIASLIAKPLADAKPPMAPDNLSEIVTQQLKNYPWATAVVTLKSNLGRPELTLDLARRPLVPGEPGHSVEATIDGRKVRVNYPLQIRNYTLAMPRQTIESLLATLTGLQRLVVEPYTPGASPGRPTTDARGSPEPQ